MSKPTKLILFNKPYGVHSQFRKEHEGMATLADFFEDKSLRVAGRLDKDSEGLLVLTDNGALNHHITTPPTAKNTKPSQKLAKTYLVQVENLPTKEQLAQLRAGVLLKDGKTLPAKVSQLTQLPIRLWERQPPIRERKSIPTAWLSISIVEGKNRQVRRMVAAVGLPCLRLIRHRVGDWCLEDLAVGESRTLYLYESDLQALGVVADTIKPPKAIKSDAKAQFRGIRRHSSQPNSGRRTKPAQGKSPKK